MHFIGGKFRSLFGLADLFGLFLVCQSGVSIWVVSRSHRVIFWTLFLLQLCCDDHYKLKTQEVYSFACIVTSGLHSVVIWRKRIIPSVDVMAKNVRSKVDVPFYREMDRGLRRLRYHANLSFTRPIYEIWHLYCLRPHNDMQHTMCYVTSIFHKWSWLSCAWYLSCQKRSVFILSLMFFLTKVEWFYFSSRAAHTSPLT